MTKIEVPTSADVRGKVSSIELPNIADVRERVAKVELPKVELPKVADLRADAGELVGDAQEQATALYRKVLDRIK